LSRSYEIEDTHEGEPSEFFEDSAAIIARIKEERSLIFVHCTEGKSIAPTIVLNYMMQSAKKQNKHLSLLAAYNFLGAKAPGINVTDQFMAQLLGTKPTPTFVLAAVLPRKHNSRGAPLLEPALCLLSFSTLLESLRYALCVPLCDKYCAPPHGAAHFTKARNSNMAALSIDSPIASLRTGSYGPGAQWRSLRVHCGRLFLPLVEGGDGCHEHDGQRGAAANIHSISPPAFTLFLPLRVFASVRFDVPPW